MHCPSCGNESSIDQKFCRKCGFNLEPVGKLLAGGNAIRGALAKTALPLDVRKASGFPEPLSNRRGEA